MYYAIIQDEFGEEGKEIKGITENELDAIKFCAELSDKNSEDEVSCYIEEYDGLAVNNENIPKTLYTLFFNESKQLVNIVYKTYTYEDWFKIFYNKFTRYYVMYITFDYNIPEHTAVEEAKEKMEQYFLEF